MNLSNDIKQEMHTVLHKKKVRACKVEANRKRFSTPRLHYKAYRCDEQKITERDNVHASLLCRYLDHVSESQLRRYN